MGRIVCEVCGSTDLVKQDAVFVCQSCGCKYSLEEVRKMIGKESVTVQPVSRAEQSLEYNNLKKATYEAMVDGRFESAYSNSMRLLTIQPDDPETIAVQALVVLGKDKMPNDIPTSTANGMDRFYSMLPKWEENYSIKIEIISHVRRYVMSVCNSQSLLLREEISTLDAQKIKTSKADTLGEIGNALGVLAGDFVSLGMGMNDEREKKRRDAHNRVIESQIDRIHDKERALEHFRYNQIRKLDSLLSETKKADADNREQRKQEYWKEHPEQKAELENRIKVLETERQPVLDEIKSKEQLIKQLKNVDVPLKKKASELNEEVRRLNQKLFSLGMFKGREKKQLIDKIRSLTSQIPGYSELEEARKKEIERVQPRIEETQSEVESLQQKANQLSKQIEDLQNELNMDR